MNAHGSMASQPQRNEVEPETWTIVAGRPEAAPGATLNAPIVAASTYVLGGERMYSRNEATQGWEAFEAMLGGLEGGQAVAFASGMAACAAVLTSFPSGAHLVLVEDCYQGVAAVADAGAQAHGWRVERLHAPTSSGAQRAGEADMLWLESPSNPLLEVADLDGDLRARPARPARRVVVDNTFATPLLQRPLEFGADIVVHSATKLIGGHSDLLLGAAVTDDAEHLAEPPRRRGAGRRHTGNARGFLALRGARTLALSLARHRHRPAARAAARRATPRHRVRYPGFGTIVSFELRDAEAADAACPAVADHPPRHQPRRGRDLDGAAESPPGPGAHPARADPAERRLRARRGRVARPCRRPRISAGWSDDRGPASS